MIEEKRNLRITCNKCGVSEEYTVYTEVPDPPSGKRGFPRRIPEDSDTGIHLFSTIPVGWKRVTIRDTKDRHYCNNCNNGNKYGSKEKGNMKNPIRMFLELYQSLALRECSSIHLTIGTCRSYTDAAQLTVRIGKNIIATATLVDDYSQYPGGPTYGPIIGKASHVEIIADEMGIRYNRCEAHSDTSCSQDWYNRAMELSIREKWRFVTWVECGHLQAGYLVPAFGNYTYALFIDGYERRPVFISETDAAQVIASGLGCYPHGTNIHSEKNKSLFVV